MEDLIGSIIDILIGLGLYDLGIFKRKRRVVDKPSGPVYKSDGSLANERKEGQS